MTIKIYGYGWVGKAMKILFPDALIHDPYTQRIVNGEPMGGYIDETTADIAFVCVPTPTIKARDVVSISPTRPGNNDGKGALDCSIVEQVVKEAKEDLIIIRSTVMPGTCDKLGKNIVYQPEYIGEGVAPSLINEAKTPFMILGGSPKNRRRAIELYQTVYNANITIRQVTNYEAEVIKLSENRAILFKVVQCQELYDACEKAGVDYYTIREAVYGDDPRFNLRWTFVYPNNRGANSKCIPKDVYGWAAWAESLGYDPKLTKNLLEVNNGLISNNTK
jgi:UDPglucose 6-dehydrogenase